MHATTQEDPATRAVEVRIGDTPLLAQKGQRLIELCDAHVTPLQFGCRAGSCGMCLIRVIRGMQNLSRVTDNEEILLPELTDDPAARLGCQVRVLGPVCILPATPFST